MVDTIVSTEGSEAARTPVAVGRNTPSMSAAWLLLAAAATLFLAGRIAPLEMAHLVFFSMSIGLCAVSVFAFWVRAVSDRLEVAIEASFREIFDGDDKPAAITDADCRILTINKAARSRNAECGSVDYAGQLFAAWAHDADEVVYRLARSAIEQGAASEVMNSVTPMRLSARKIQGGRIIWSMDSAETQAVLSVEDAPFGFAWINAQGAVRSENEIFQTYSNTERTEIVESALRAQASGQGWTGVSVNGGRSVSTAVHLVDLGDLSLYVFPEWAEASHSRELVFEQIPVALARLTPEGDVISINAAARSLLGPGARAGVAFDSLVEGMGRGIQEQLTEVMEGGATARSELAVCENGEREVFLQISLGLLDFDGGASVLAVLSDATEQKTLEQQFVQSQKMQAVGQLAGGVAHDFNNLLTVILGHCDLLMLRSDASTPDYADLTQIRQNANRAAALVRQLLAFSRKQTLQPQSVGIGDTLAELSHLLNRLIGERIIMKLNHEDGLWPVWIDKQQFEQVIVNLVVNARDAMPEGGAVTLSCANNSLSEEMSRDRAVVEPGDYVQIQVSDTGMGIRPDRLDKIFEPFFTTKKVGEGTGLGLSTAYGIVKQMGGFIFVDSAEAKRTTFTLLLPRAASEQIEEAQVETENKAADLTGSGVILLVEDEAPVRAFGSRALQMRGYQVMEADCAEAALQCLEDCDCQVDLVVSDVVMPGIDGPTWVREARKTRPDLPVVFVSGYAEDVFRKSKEEVGADRFLSKPFSLDQLSTEVKAALDAQKPN
ncbi:MAG: response regulator [Paracoccaceae bacterium]|nr:response regulator [Paracoccaceae bacterium]MDG1369049.1 response regulator [Paracoccaceae bacterium]